MKNRGQITVFFSCMISVLLILTFTALEVGRIYCGRMKIRAAVRSAQSCILADYNRALFEKYHLLFEDPTYGTGSFAMVEEKFRNYLDESLNGNDYKKNLYNFDVCEVALSDHKTITDDHMKLLKKQIVDYEKNQGALKKIIDSGKQMVDASEEVGKASEKTSKEATEITVSSENENGNDDGGSTDDNETGEAQEKVDDPRDVLKDMLSKGMLALLLPADSQISDEKQDFSQSLSNTYEEKVQKDRDTGFGDVTKLVEVLETSAKEDKTSIINIGEKASFCAYVGDHFSYQGNYKDTVMHCEVEYIIKGKNSDHDNLEAVLSDIIWMRMPVNYVCLLQDAPKQSEAFTLATAICTSTGTMPMVEIVKYLLLGCWSYGESIYEVRLMMQGEKLPYVKTSAEWNTDLKSLKKANNTISSSVGMGYIDYLNLMLAKKESKDIAYARLLDMIELNLKQEDENLSMVNMCGEFVMQGKVRLQPVFIEKSDTSAYEYYFQEQFSY